jgi:hypothetical protein
VAEPASRDRRDDNRLLLLWDPVPCVDQCHMLYGNATVEFRPRPVLICAISVWYR